MKDSRGFHSTVDVPRLTVDESNFMWADNEQSSDSTFITIFNVQSVFSAIVS